MFDRWFKLVKSFLEAYERRTDAIATMNTASHDAAVELSNKIDRLSVEVGQFAVKLDLALEPKPRTPSTTSKR